MGILPYLVCAFAAFLVEVYRAHLQQMSGKTPFLQQRSFALRLANGALERAKPELEHFLQQHLPVRIVFDKLELLGMHAAFEEGELLVRIRCDVRFKLKSRIVTPLVSFSLESEELVELSEIVFSVRKSRHSLRISGFEAELACGPSVALSELLLELCRRLPGLEIPC